MDLAELKILDGNRHPWEVSRTSTLRHLFNSLHLNTEHKKILDIGCGDGYTVSELFNTNQPVIDAVDTSLSEELIAEFSARHPSISFHHSTNSLKKEFYDIVTIFDVIEHTKDDVAFLKEMYTLAAPGAIFILTAPAFNRLYSNHDSFLGHHRRYNKKQLEEVLRSGGLNLMSSGYIFSSLLLFRTASVGWGKLSPGNKEFSGVTTWRYGKSFTSLIARFLATENKITLWLNRYGITIPGLSVWAICRKPQ
nr:class I SAM-dependent methyltransferase [Desulfobulbaceae bacterium]